MSLTDSYSRAAIAVASGESSPIWGRRCLQAVIQAVADHEGCSFEDAKLFVRSDYLIQELLAQINNNDRYPKGA